MDCFRSGVLKGDTDAPSTAGSLTEGAAGRRLFSLGLLLQEAAAAKKSTRQAHRKYRLGFTGEDLVFF